MNGTALVGGNGKGRLTDHSLQHPLLQRHRVLVVHLRQLRIVVGGQAQNLKAGVAAGQADHQLFIGGKNDHIIRHAADDVAEQAGIQYDAARLADIRLHSGADAGLGVIAGQLQHVVGL